MSIAVYCETGDFENEYGFIDNDDPVFFFRTDFEAPNTVLSGPGLLCWCSPYLEGYFGIQ